MYRLNWSDVAARASVLASENLTQINKRVYGYGVPRGGVFAALAVQAAYRPLNLVEQPEDADVIIDDVLDSGSTFASYRRRFGDKPFLVLVNKHDENIHSWVQFPWNRMEKEDGPQDNIRRILQYIGEDPNREGLRETPDRVVRSYAELFAGYKQDPADIFKTFDGDGYDEIVLLKDIEIHSMCEHHMLPFIGRAHVAYIPDGKVIGLSKLARLVDIFARRLQIQEKLTTQVTEALNANLRPRGAACVIEAKHLCVSCRGVQKQHSSMVTSSLTGAFKEEHSARQELLTLIYGGR